MITTQDRSLFILYKKFLNGIGPQPPISLLSEQFTLVRDFVWPRSRLGHSIHCIMIHYYTGWHSRCHDLQVGSVGYTAKIGIEIAAILNLLTRAVDKEALHLTRLLRLSRSIVVLLLLEED